MPDDKDKSKKTAIPVTMEDLRESARVGEQGLATIYLPSGDVKQVATEDLTDSGLEHEGTHEILNLTDDLMLTRMDIQRVHKSVQHQRYDLQYDGWLFLHFRLDGLSREASSSGGTAMVGRNSFILSASRQGEPVTREVLGDSWRTVGIVCQPSFVARELQMRNEELPEELQRFQSGEEDVQFWYAGEMTNEMASVANSLLHPSVTGSMRPIYLRAKTVELMCLAMDGLQQSQPTLNPTLHLGRYDVSCLNRARGILEQGRELPSLGDLARQVGLNRNKLAAGFKHVFGMTIGAYHRELRLDRAHQALQEGVGNIGYIAEEAGYRDAGSFTKAFKARYGMLPSEVIHDRVLDARTK